MPSELRIGTRGSQLALFQANWVKDQLSRAHPDLNVTLIKIKTTGDKIQDVPLAKIGGKGLFVKEIEESLLQRKVDLAVLPLYALQEAHLVARYRGLTPELQEAHDLDAIY